MRKLNMCEYLVGGLSDKGLFRTKNQDRFWVDRGVCHLGSYALACVCDGVGSYRNSEVAAEIVIQGIRLWCTGLKAGKLNHLDLVQLKEDLNDSLFELNEIIYEKELLYEERYACTMSLIFILNGKYHIYHAGDSRIYMISENCSQLTVDETVISDTDGKKKLVNCFGLKRHLQILYYEGTITDECIFVIGSDGLFHRMHLCDVHLDKEDIQTDDDIRNLCKKLIDYVETVGEKDNVTCALIKYIKY